MAEPLYDLESGEALRRISVDMAEDAAGRVLLRTSERTAVEMEGGRLRFTSRWPLDEDEFSGDMFP